MPISQVPNRPNFQLVAAHVIKTMTSLEQRFPYLLQHGWRAYVQIESPDIPKDSFFSLNLCHDNGGGSYVKAKLHTMSALDLAYTGRSKICDVLTDLRDLIAEEDRETFRPQLQKIGQYVNVSELPTPLLEWMRDILSYTPYLGGLNVPYSGIVVEENMRQTNGLISIAFSGASEEQDVMFACHLLQAVMDGMIEARPITSHTFDVSDLLKHPTLRLWLDLTIGTGNEDLA